MMAFRRGRAGVAPLAAGIACLIGGLATSIAIGAAACADCSAHRTTNGAWPIVSRDSTTTPTNQRPRCAATEAGTTAAGGASMVSTAALESATGGAGSATGRAAGTGSSSGGACGTAMRDTAATRWNKDVRGTGRVGSSSSSTPNSHIGSHTGSWLTHTTSPRWLMTSCSIGVNAGPPRSERDPT